jgi:hypothetical protein
VPYRLVSVCTQCRKAVCNCVDPRGWSTKIRKWFRPFWEEIELMKERVKAMGDSRGIPAKGLLVDYPLLWECMTADVYDSGKKRRRSTLLLMADGPAFKLLLLDKDTNEQAWFMGESIDGALAAAEEALATGAAPWQPARQPTSGRTR